MISAAAIVAGILNLSDAEFFSADPAAMAARESRLLETDFTGVAVNAPAIIDTRRHNKLPLMMAARFSGDRDWDIPLSENCVLVGTDLRDGSVHFARGLVVEKELTRFGELKTPKGPKPEGLASEAAQITELDARGRLHIGWNTGTWSLGVINYDWPSNTVVVELKGDKPVRLAWARLVSPLPNPAAVSGHKASNAALPSYFPTAKTPPFPDSGVSFTVEYRVVQGKQQLIVFGAFVVPAREFELPREKMVHQFQDGRQEKVAAVIPLTLAVLAQDWPVPLQFDWAVPVYGNDLKPGAPARGCIEIDAFTTGNTHSLAPGKYLCYLVTDGRIFGPQPLKVE